MPVENAGGRGLVPQQLWLGDLEPTGITQRYGPGSRGISLA